MLLLVVEYFKAAISRQYPSFDACFGDQVDMQWEDALAAPHQEFESKRLQALVRTPLLMEKLEQRLLCKDQNVKGRTDIDFQSVLQRLPLTIFGGRGVGKSSLLIEFLDQMRRRGHSVLFHTVEVINWNEDTDAYQNTVFSIDTRTTVAQLYLRICLAVGNHHIRSECTRIVNQLDAQHKNEQANGSRELPELSPAKRLEILLPN